MRIMAAGLVFLGMLWIPRISIAAHRIVEGETPTNAVKVRLDEPVLIDQAAPEVKAWGSFGFPKVYRLPDGKLGLTFRPLARDHESDHGKLSPVFVSSDEGHTWQRSRWPHPGMTGQCPVITQINDGEYWSLPAVTGIRLDLSRLPKPVATFDSYDGFPLYRLEDCPEDVIRWFKDLRGVRWSPKTKRWTEESVQWDHSGQLMYSYGDKINGVWSQKIFLEGPVLRNGKELMYADYWTVHETKPGQEPLGWECSLMVSTDNGHSWKRRSSMATLPAHDNTAEPTLEMNQAGELVGVMRRQNGSSSPSMYLVRSKDNGYTWSERQPLFQFGVLPRLLQLQNGVLVLTFGRPGVWLSFSLDGGYSWTKPQAIIAGDPKKPMVDSSGYTSLLALGKDSFLLAYDDWQRPNAKGEPCKTVLVRRITVEKADK